MKYSHINEDKIELVVNELNILLADYHIYYQNLRTYHWNILGKNFFDLHVKFETLYIDAREKIDEIAERILTLRFHPLSKASQYLEISNIKEADLALTDTDMVDRIIENHKSILQQMTHVFKQAANIGDEGTVDLIGAYIRELEKQTWMLNAWSHKTNGGLKMSKMPTK